MFARVFSAAVYGIDGFSVEIEVNTGSAVKTVIVVVGLPDTAVKESQERVTTAIANSGYRWPKGRTVVNLAPADMRKEGPSFDLPIALAMLALPYVGRRLDQHLTSSQVLVLGLAVVGVNFAHHPFLPTINLSEGGEYYIEKEGRRDGESQVPTPRSATQLAEWLPTGGDRRSDGVPTRECGWNIKPSDLNQIQKVIAS